MGDSGSGQETFHALVFDSFWLVFPGGRAGGGTTIAWDFDLNTPTPTTIPDRWA